MTEQELAEIEARCAAATPGEWFWDSYSRVLSEPLCKIHAVWERENIDSRDVDSITEDEWQRLAAAEPETDVCSVPRQSGDTATKQAGFDATFISHARIDVPDLLAEVHRLRDVIERYAAIAEHIDPEFAAGLLTVLAEQGA